MVAASALEEVLWKLVQDKNGAFCFVRDGITIKTLHGDHAKPEFHRLKTRSSMEAAYKAAQDWFSESLNRGNPVPGNVLWPRYGNGDPIKPPNPAALALARTLEPRLRKFNRESGTESEFYVDFEKDALAIKVMSRRK
jgi:hypothetical protein